MTRSLTFDYDHAYYPAAPQVEITVDGYDPDYVPVTLFVFADSGLACLDKNPNEPSFAKAKAAHLLFAPRMSAQ